MQPNRIRTIAFLLNDLNMLTTASRAKLLRDCTAEFGGHSKEAFDQAWRTLLQCGTLELSPKEGERNYRIRPGGQFFVIGSWKSVGMSRRGDRSLRIMSEQLALCDGIAEKIVGSIVWKKKMYSPKPRLEQIVVSTPWTRKSRSAKFEIAHKEKNNQVFKLIFDPPLKAGEYVKYRFYIWSRKHYAMSRREALESYHDEWIREGLAVKDSTQNLTIVVKLPDGYRCQKVRVEKNPLLVDDGPNIPGSLVSISKDSDFRVEEKALRLTMSNPKDGRYFVCWIPPD
jgi:hypothetical protein